MHHSGYTHPTIYASMRVSTFITLFLAFCVNYVHAGKAAKGMNQTSRERIRDPEIHMNASEIVARWGYVPEEHTVTTADGYLITIIRVSPREVKQRGVQRPVVFLQHGLECSATEWIQNLPSQSAGFYFADQGFDVWLGNVRGNRYGKEHKSLTVKDTLFWNFTWVEIAEYDLPAIVDKVLEVTGQRQLFYVGHSQGTLTFFAKASTDPEFAGKIRKMYALAPVYTLGGVKGLYGIVAKFVGKYKSVQHKFGKREFLSAKSPIVYVTRKLCPSVVTRRLCRAAILSGGGDDFSQVNLTRMGVILAHYPSGTSAKNFEHFMQLIHSGKCQKFDYGTPAGNEYHYGQDTPPEYSVEGITTPIALFYSRNDKMALVENVESKLIPDLGEAVKERFVFGDLNHYDFTWGVKAVDNIYRHIVHNMQAVMSTIAEN